MSETPESGTRVKRNDSIEREKLDNIGILKQEKDDEFLDLNFDNDDEYKEVSGKEKGEQMMIRYSLMKCDLKIKHLSFPALFDTGSAASLLSMDIFAQIPRNCMQPAANCETLKRFQTVSGEIMGSLGCYTIKFAIPSNNERTFKHNFHIIANLKAGIILGIDFMTKHELILFPRDRTLGYFKENIPHRVILNDIIPVMNIDFCKEKANVNAPEKHKQKVIDLLEKNPFCVAEKVSDLGCTTVAEHRIMTIGEPVSEKMRRTPHALRPIVKQKIDEMLKHQIIRKSTSQFSAPLVMVKKKGGEYRMCVDYRKLNRCTIREKYPLPNILDTLDALGGATYFSCLDLFSGYWQLGLHEGDKHKTSFVCEFGQFEFNRLPFGLVNGPSTFQRTIASIFEKAHFEFLLIYLDDLIIFSKTLEEHIAHLEEVFDILHKAGLRLNLRKCHFFKKRIEYLGHVVTGKGVWPNKKNIESIENFPEPKNVRQLQGYLGLSTYYRRFVRNYADIAHPLYILLKKSTPWQWGEEQKNAFNSIKDSLTSFPCLRHPEFSRDFIVQTDASGFGVGAILCQMQPRLRPKGWLKGQKTDSEKALQAKDVNSTKNRNNVQTENTKKNRSTNNNDKNEKNTQNEIKEQTEDLNSNFTNTKNKRNKNNKQIENINKSVNTDRKETHVIDDIETLDNEEYWKPADETEIINDRVRNNLNKEKRFNKAYVENENHKLDEEDEIDDIEDEEDNVELEEVVIAYSSRHLKESERKYTTTE